MLRVAGQAFIILPLCWLLYAVMGVGPTLSHAQVGPDTPTWGGPFLNGVFPRANPGGLGGDWVVVPAFPSLPVPETTTITHNPVNGQIWVGSWDGLIQAFNNDPAVNSAETIIDLRDRVLAPGGNLDGGLFGIALHPDFGQLDSPFRNYFYVYYASFCPLNNQLDTVDLAACDPNYPTDANEMTRLVFFNVYLRLSRFEIPDGSTQADKASEVVLFNIRYINAFHRGGGPIFGRDGYLYMAIGDQSTFHDAQNISTGLNGGALRLAVDVVTQDDGTWLCPAGSHMPRRTFQSHILTTDDEISGRFYCIPDDNPWVDTADDQNFEEYFAIGLRNPHRITADRLTGRIWVGDVGLKEREEIDIIEAGRNYGWPFREGLTEGPKSRPQTVLGVLTDPVIDIPLPEARAIIGGYVYRGSRFPDLYGKYLAGDNVSGRIWAFTLDENAMQATKTLLTTWTDGALGFSTWGEDQSGELYLGHARSTMPLLTLTQVLDPTPDAPQLLSQTGAFDNLEALVPSALWLPYKLHQPFWSDGAVKQRWIALPAGEQIGFSENDNWLYPVGTVLMKHFELPLSETNPALTTRLETRFMVHGEGGWYGVTYRWNDTQTDAMLLTGTENAVYSIATADGLSREQVWTFPSRADCLTCHNAAAGGALGPRTHQVNGQLLYPQSGVMENQLVVWNQLGMLSPALDPASIPLFLRSVALDDVSATLEDRARSYLDANCSYCHRPETGNRAVFDARLTTPLVDQGLINGVVLEPLGLPNETLVSPGCPACSTLYQRMESLASIAMPPLLKSRVDVQGLALMQAWIEALGIQGAGERLGITIPR